MTFRRSVSQRTVLTLGLVAGLLLAFAGATYLSYYGEVRINDAFNYQSAVVAAQRDSEVLETEQFDRKSSIQELRPYEKLLDEDLVRLDQIAQIPEEKAPHFGFPATRDDYERLTEQLKVREALGAQRFERTVARNTQTRDLSNALFALVALLFVVLQGRLRRRIEENRSLVERLQRAFISRRREVPNIDAGSVLISATRGSYVGGDLHDVYTYDGRHAMFLVADVSGKGIEAAVDTALIKYSVRALFTEFTDPGVVLGKFAAMYSRTASNPEMFVVAFLGVIDITDGSVRYASAGHEPAWAAFGHDVIQLPPTGPVIGIEDESVYETQLLHLRAGDRIVVSTDGLTESRDTRGRLLGAEGVKAWLAELSGTAQQIADAIVKRLRRRSRRIGDDLAILVVRYELVPAPAQRLVVVRESEPALVSGEPGS